MLILEIFPNVGDHTDTGIRPTIAIGNPTTGSHHNGSRIRHTDIGYNLPDIGTHLHSVLAGTTGGLQKNH